jgi:hypothetical protein
MKIKLTNGTEKDLQFRGPGVVCLVCGEEYTRLSFGYCDETIECANDEGEHTLTY